MSYDRDEYLRLRPAKPVQPSDRSYRIAALRAADVTHDEKWDAFKAFLEPHRRIAAEARDEALFALQDPRVIRPDAIMAAKLAYHVAAARLETLEEVMAFPAQLGAAVTEDADGAA